MQSFETSSTQEDFVKKTILTAILLAIPMAAFAADVFDVKPGLWEQTATMEMAGMPAMQGMPQMTPEQLAQLPPAARERIQAMMQGRGGMGQPMTVKVCRTKESLADAMSYAARQDNSCTTKITNMSASKVEVHTECSGRFTGSGDFMVERIDSEHTKMTGAMKGVASGSKSGQDTPVTTKMTITGKWLSPDCGDVKPLGAKQ